MTLECLSIILFVWYLRLSNNLNCLDLFWSQTCTKQNKTRPSLTSAIACKLKYSVVAPSLDKFSKSLPFFEFPPFWLILVMSSHDYTSPGPAWWLVPVLAKQFHQSPASRRSIVPEQNSPSRPIRNCPKSQDPRPLPCISLQSLHRQPQFCIG